MILLFVTIEFVLYAEARNGKLAYINLSVECDLHVNDSGLFR